MYTYDREWSPAQRQAIESRGRNVVVSAGAGSGKTSVLVERVVLCIAGPDPVDLDQLLIVTFTEAAAAEMRRRIQDRLHELHRTAAAAGDGALVARLARQLALLDQAQISTLHSFCMNIVRRNFLALGLDPSFTVQSEDELALLQDEVLQSLLEERLRDAATAPATVRMLKHLGAVSPLSIAGTVYRLDEFARSQPDPSAWLTEMAERFARAAVGAYSELPWLPAFHAWVERQVGDADAALKEAAELAGLYAELADYAAKIESARDALVTARQMREEGAPYEAWCNVIAAALKLRPRAGDHEYKARVQKLRKAGHEKLQRVLAVCGRGEQALQADVAELAPDMATLARLVQDFQEQCATRKRMAGGLDFNDLEHFALAALQDEQAGEALRLQEQFAEVFVDEYQDTSPIQDAVIAHVARAQGNVFVVGDVKQSIYRFRMAQPQIFLDRYQAGLGAQGGVVDLPDNYRSRPLVVSAVNFLFQHFFSADFGGIAYDERAQMRVGADYPECPGKSLDGPVELHLIERLAQDDGHGDGTELSGDAAQGAEEAAVEDGAESSLSLPADAEDGQTRLHKPAAADAGEEPKGDELSAIEQEITVIAARIRALMGLAPDTQRSLVWDKDAKAYRPLAYRDIAVLMRSVRGRMNAVLDVFRRAGIPAYGQTSTGFYHALEIRWLTALLCTLDNPHSDVDLAALLRSPLGGFDDVELAVLRGKDKGPLIHSLRRAARSGSSANLESWPGPPAYADKAAATARKASEFVKRLERWRTLARRASSETVLRSVLDETGFRLYLTGMAGGDIRTANVDLLLDFAHTFDGQSTDGVHGLVDRIRATIGLDIDAGEARTLAQNEDVVRVTTIHQSKGLEYPVVFVADLGKQFYRDPEERNMPLHPTLGFGPQRVSDAGSRWRTLPSIAIDEVERTAFLAEEARVLYVALTRARERLILVGSASRLKVVLERAQTAVAAARGSTALPPLLLQSGRTYLDWLLPALLRHPDGAGSVESMALARERATAKVPTFGSRFQWTLWNLPDTPKLPDLERSDEQAAGLDHRQAQEADAALPVADTGAAAAGNKVAREVWAALSWQDRDRPLRGVPGKVSATELRRMWVAAQHQQGARPGVSARRASAERLLEDPGFVRQQAALTGRARGSAFHSVMQYLDFRITPDVSTVARELERIVDQQLVAKDVMGAAEAEQIVVFLQSELGVRLAAAKRVLREQSFVGRIELPTPDSAERPFVVVQGVIDVLAEEADGWLIVDYKTDRVDKRSVYTQAQEYSAQLGAYLAAVQALVGSGRVSAYTYFVEPGVAVPMPAVEVARVFGAAPG